MFERKPGEERTKAISNELIEKIFMFKENLKLISQKTSKGD